MDFKKMKEQMRAHFDKMIKNQDNLFVTLVDKDELWNEYIDSFPKGTNEIFREKRVHECSCCKSFIRHFGAVISIVDGEKKTIWDFENEEYQPILDAMSELVKSRPVMNVYVSKLAKIGTDFNHETINGDLTRWEHFFIELPSNLINTTKDSIGDIEGSYKSNKDVFKRALSEITIDSINTVIELIDSNSIYKGQEYRRQVQTFLTHKRAFDKADEKDLYSWLNSSKVTGAVSKIKNTSIGTLLVDISEGVVLDVAVAKYESKVAPENYKRPKAIYTKQMLENAKREVVKLGLEGSLGRRHASIEDITVNNILFINRDITKDTNLDVFGEMEKDVVVNVKKFSKVEEVSMEKFVNDILPHARKIEVLLENKHKGNLVSLIAPKDNCAKSLFKWDNAFSWAYNGNITDSSMKENVKSHGGDVNGELRFSIQWNDLDTHNNNDLDAHCIEPSGNRIYFGRKKGYTGGVLDVDIQSTTKGKPAVENITWADLNRMEEGTYQFIVNNYSHCGGRDGFCAEIEFDGSIHSFEYRKDIKDGEKVLVAEVKYSKATGFQLIEKLPSTTSSKEIWGLNTNHFHEVSTVMFSPNAWEGHSCVGNRHLFFMMKDCVNDQSPNGFFNEYLKQELNEHKRVFECLGAKMRVDHTENQLSGLGFSSTRRNELMVKVEGHTKRTFKIKL